LEIKPDPVFFIYFFYFIFYLFLGLIREEIPNHLPLSDPWASLTAPFVLFQRAGQRQEITEEFYTPGSEGLLKARMDITRFSLPRSHFSPFLHFFSSLTTFSKTKTSYFLCSASLLSSSFLSRGCSFILDQP
jgi:hypothetical protein